MIYAVGHISGAHFNGAVTFAFAVTRHFPWSRAAWYWLAQLTGAIAAAAVLRASLGNIAHVGATFPSGSDAQSFLWELLMSAFLMFVILAVATDTRAVGEAAAIAVGGTILLDAMFGGPISGASMNPMRSAGPRDRLRRPALALDLPHRAGHRHLPRRPRVPVRARRDRPPGLAAAGVRRRLHDRQALRLRRLGLARLDDRAVHPVGDLVRERRR